MILSLFLLITFHSTAQNISVVLRTSTSAPSVSTINPPAGFSNSAAAPFAGTAWNTIGASSTIPSGTAPGTYSLYSGLPLVNSSDASIAETLSVTYTVVSTTLKSEPAGSSGENTLQPGGVMQNAWRNYDNGAGSYFTFVISNLPASTPYGIYYYGATTGSGQFGALVLPTANTLPNSPSTSATSNTNANSNGNFGSLWTVSGGTTNLMLQATTWNTIYGQSDATGVFRLEFKGSGSAAYLNGFQIVPLSAPVISNLTNQTVIQGNSAILSAAISGLPAASLQWLSNNIALPGQTNATLALNNIQYAQNGTTWSLVASNIVGAVTNSLTLTVIVTPAITGLNNQANSVGSSVILDASVSGVPAPALQWQFNGVNVSDGRTGHGSTISGSESDALNIANAQAADSGTWSLVASNSAGLVTNSMVLTVSSTNVPPDISGPANQTVVQGSNATFTVSVSGLPLPTEQWYVQGTEIPGATNSSLTISNILYSQNGYLYSLVASNSAGLKTNSATLFVLVPPQILQQPTNLIVTNTQSATFVVSAGGVPSPSYQWLFNGTPIHGAVTSNYVIASVSTANMGNYSVVISNSVGSINSATASLTVNSTMSVVALGPANGATGICYDTPLYITFSSPPLLTTPGTGKIRIYNANNPVTPVDTLDMSQNVTLETPFAVNVQQRTIAGETFYSYPVIITGNTAAIYPHLDLLTSNQTYYVTIDSTAFTDANGAYFTGISATNVWSFKTKTGSPANPTNILVSQDNAGDFVTIQGAIDSVPANNSTQTQVNIHNGTYTEIVEAHAKNNILLRGQSRQGTVIAYANNGNMNANTHLEIVFKDNANSVSLDNLTLDDTSGLGSSPAEALMIESGAKKFICNNVTIESYQDTMLANQSSSQGYFNNCLIQGSVDFIWGGGNLFYTNCQILWLTQGGEGPNPSPSSSDINSNGFDFINCSLTTAAGIGNCLVGRTRGITNGNTVLIQCLVSPNIGGWSSDALPTSNFRNWYYSCSNLTATASITLSNGVQLAAGNPNVANASSVTSWLYGWNPALSPNITLQPTNENISGSGKISLAVGATGVPDPTYQWQFNGAAISGAINAAYVINNANVNNAGIYSVIVSNPSGIVVSSNAIVVVSNSPPTLAPVPNQTINAGATLTITNIATDPDSPPQQLSFSLPIGPTNAIIDASTGIFTWRPTVSQAGTTNPVSVEVSDNGSPILTATNVFDVIVNPLFRPKLTAALNASGQLSITVSGGTVGPDYQVQVSTNLIDWQTLLLTNSPPQPFTFSASNDSFSSQFYRVALFP